MTQQSGGVSFKDVERVMHELVLPFGAIERSVPVPVTDGYRNENNAEHSWTLALVASMLAPRLDPSLDVGKICQYAVVHDLVEVYSGDTSIFASEEAFQTQADRERRAFERLAREFSHFPWLAECIEAYEKQNTVEARFVRAIDALLPIAYDYISQGAYYHRNGTTKEDFIKFRQRSREKARGHEAGLVLHDELVAVMAGHPELFYKN